MHLVHDCGWIGVTESMKVVAPFIPPDEFRRIHDELFQIMLATIESYVVMKNRIDQRLSPTSN